MPYEYYMLLNTEDIPTVRCFIEAWDSRWVVKADEKEGAQWNEVTILSSPRYWVGVEYGRELACLYMVGKQCDRTDKPYAITNDVKKLFNWLLKRTLVWFSLDGKTKLHYYEIGQSDNLYVDGQTLQGMGENLST